MSCAKCKDWHWLVCNDCRGVPPEPPPDPTYPELRSAYQEDRASAEKLDRMAWDLFKSGYDPNRCRCGGRMRPEDPNTGAWRECLRCGWVDSEAG